MFSLVVTWLFCLRRFLAFPGLPPEVPELLECRRPILRGRPWLTFVRPWCRWCPWWSRVCRPPVLRRPSKAPSVFRPELLGLRPSGGRSDRRNRIRWLFSNLFRRFSSGCEKMFRTEFGRSDPRRRLGRGSHLRVPPTKKFQNSNLAFRIGFS